MAVSPQVFLSYGRPDRDIAQRVGAEFWARRVECYNYLAKPIEDRGIAVMPHRDYIPGARLFVAIISGEAVWRELVVEEIFFAHRLASVMDNRATAYIVKAADFETLPRPTVLIDWRVLIDVPAAVTHILNHMGAEYLDRCQTAWETNKGLFRNEWNELDALYRRPASE